MTIFSQGDPKWGNKKLGSSGCTMKKYGCLTTAIAQALYIQGHNTDPGIFVDKMNKVGGYTKDGLLIWSKVSQIYPAFHYGSGSFIFQRGTYKGYQHWVLTYNGKDYDPLFGKPYKPSGFKDVSQKRASIDKASSSNNNNQGVKPMYESGVIIESIKDNTLWTVPTDDKKHTKPVDTSSHGIGHIFAKGWQGTVVDYTKDNSGSRITPHWYLVNLAGKQQGWTKTEYLKAVPDAGLKKAYNEKVKELDKLAKDIKDLNERYAEQSKTIAELKDQLAKCGNGDKEVEGAFKTIINWFKKLIKGGE